LQALKRDIIVWIEIDMLRMKGMCVDPTNFGIISSAEMQECFSLGPTFSAGICLYCKMP